MRKFGNFSGLASALALGLAGSAAAQASFKYGTCPDVSEANFEVKTLLSNTIVKDIEEPVRFSVAKDGRVFVGERNGTVRVVKPDGSVVKIGQVPVQDIHSNLNKNGSNEFGLDGLVLDRNFETTGWIYLYYQVPKEKGDLSKLSRFKVTGTTLDLASEQNLMTWAYQRDYCCHTGGGMQFDNKGDLWLSIGNNTRNPTPNETGSPLAYVDESEASRDDQGHAANTFDLRGKIIRIHPEATAGAGGLLYTIPAGNMKEAFAALWAPADQAKVRPEIYTMGHRSNWSLSVDTVKNLLAWGEIGPDDGFETEEFNMTQKPGNFGWPYFAGATGNAHYKYRMDKDPAAPINTSKWNTGVQKLPPAIGALIGYGTAAAIAGPIYHWSAAQPSPYRLPPHFDKKWFIGEFNQNYIQAVTLADTGIKVLERKGFSGATKRLLQITIGPDGILYTLEYAIGWFTTDGNAKLKRWEYRGPECAGPAASLNPISTQGAKLGSWVNLGANLARTVSLPAGAKGFQLFDLQGKAVWEYQATDASLAFKRVSVPAWVGNGMFLASYKN